MAVGLYWWSPIRDWKSLASETLYHHRAWGYNFVHGRSHMTNFGDAVNPLVVGELTQQRVEWAPMRDADLVAVGSVLNTYVSRGSKAMILGSGVRAPEGVSDGAIDPNKILSVRGALTAQALGVPGLEGGDPGLLIKAIVSPPKRRGLEPLVIPHFAVPNTRLGRERISSLRAAGARVVQANETPREVAMAVAAAPYVITSSLHAMVFADALGVPVQLTNFSDPRNSEPTFKYRDYESIFGVQSHWHSIDEAMRQVSQRMPADARALARQSAIAEKIDRVVEGIYKSAQPLR
jgi:pyruvyltransferase